MWSHEAVCLAEQKKVRLCKGSQRFCQDPNQVNFRGFSPACSELERPDFHSAAGQRPHQLFTALHPSDNNISHIKNRFLWRPDSNYGLFLSKLSAFTRCCSWPWNSRSADCLCFFFGKWNVLKCFLGLIVTLKLEASCSAKLTSPNLPKCWTIHLLFTPSFQPLWHEVKLQRHSALVVFHINLHVQTTQKIQ